MESVKPTFDLVIAEINEKYLLYYESLKRDYIKETKQKTPISEITDKIINKWMADEEYQKEGDDMEMAWTNFGSWSASYFHHKCEYDYSSSDRDDFDNIDDWFSSVAFHYA